MSNPRRVKIENTEYNDKYNIVFWEMLDIGTGEKICQAWRGTDLGETLGIKGDIPPDLMRKFCDDMKGKELNLVMEGINIELPTSGDVANEQFEAVSKRFDEFPLDEVCRILTEGDQEESE